MNGSYFEGNEPCNPRPKIRSNYREVTSKHDKCQVIPWALRPAISSGDKWSRTTNKRVNKRVLSRRDPMPISNRPQKPTKNPRKDLNQSSDIIFLLIKRTETLRGMPVLEIFISNDAAPNTRAQAFHCSAFIAIAVPNHIFESPFPKHFFRLWK